MTINEMKEQLDSIYINGYKNRNNKISKEDCNKACDILIEISKNDDYSFSLVTDELARFPRSLSESFFEMYAKQHSDDVKKVDEAILAFTKTDNDSSRSHNYTFKYISLLSGILKDCKETLYASDMMPQLVIKVSNANSNFENLVKKTKGNIYKLNYDDYKEKTKNLWYKTKETLKKNLPEECVSKITDWAKKYGYDLPEKKVENVSENKLKESNNNKTVNIVNQVAKTIPVDKNNSDSVIKELHLETNKTIEAVTKNADSLKSAIFSLKKDFDKILELTKINTLLNEKILQLENEIKETKKLCTESEEKYEKLKKEKDALSNENLELNKQLKEVIELNKRESSLEAERLKHNISKSLELSYENWCDYVDAECSDDNYESLKAILKSIFRTLERNNIDFKGE
ncbi:MAG: hypothetical protein PUB76_05405 [Oscillospiraceae bacterium]|nr:hypothetical protein [Oscillospiraceae bacterium]